MNDPKAPPLPRIIASEGSPNRRQEHEARFFVSK